MMSSLPWFRMYHEFATDPKVQMLSEADQRRYVMLLCLRCSNGNVTLHDNEVAFQLRIKTEEWQATKKLLVTSNLVTCNNLPTAWAKRQYLSDSSAARVARHRKNKKQACNVTVTPRARTETDTDTDNKDIKEKNNKKKKSGIDLSNLSSKISKEAAQGYIDHRAKIKKPLTQRAFDLAMGKALASHEIGMTPDEAIDETVAAGWQGINLQYLSNRNSQQRTGNHHAQNGRIDNSAVARVERAIGAERKRDAERTNAIDGEFSTVTHKATH